MDKDSTNKTVVVSTDDQLFKIIEVLGNVDTSFVEKKDSQNYLNQFLTGSSTNTLKNKFASTDKDLY